MSQLGNSDWHGVARDGIKHYIEQISSSSQNYQVHDMNRTEAEKPRCWVLKVGIARVGTKKGTKQEESQRSFTKVSNKTWS